jgi:hypothetical protein
MTKEEEIKQALGIKEYWAFEDNKLSLFLMDKRTEKCYYYCYGDTTLNEYHRTSEEVIKPWFEDLYS